MVTCPAWLPWLTGPSLVQIETIFGAAVHNNIALGIAANAVRRQCNAQQRCKCILGSCMTLLACQSPPHSSTVLTLGCCVQELDEPDYTHFFVKKVVTQAMDKHDREREMASVLLSTLYNEVMCVALSLSATSA